MRSLAAFAIVKGNDVEVIELLEDHLRNVARYVSLYLRKSDLRDLGIAIALLHDVGKSLEAYQACLRSRGDNACSYVGHEAISALVTWFCAKFELSTYPSGTPRESLKSIATLSILWHHQAMGDPQDRLAEFVYRVRRDLRRADSMKLLRFDRRITSLVRNVSKSFGISIEIDEDSIAKLEEMIVNYAKMNELGTLYNELFLREVFSSVMHSEKLILLAKQLAGTLILADIFVAMNARSVGARDKPRHVHLRKMFTFLEGMGST